MTRVVHRGGFSTQRIGLLHNPGRDKYCLILHLSNMELKAAPQSDATAGA